MLELKVTCLWWHHFPKVSGFSLKIHIQCAFTHSSKLYSSAWHCCGTGDSTRNNHHKKTLISSCFYSSGRRQNRLCNSSAFASCRNKETLFTTSRSLTPSSPLLHNTAVTRCSRRRCMVLLGAAKGPRQENWEWESCEDQGNWWKSHCLQTSTQHVT